MTSPAKKRTLARLNAKASAASAGPPGWGGSGWMGGPSFVDAFRTRRAPSPMELVEAFKSIVWACSNINQSAVARTRLGLYAKTGDGQLKPKAWSCPTRPIRASAKAMARKGGGWCGSWVQKQAMAADIDEVVEHPLLTMLDRVNDDWDYDLLIRYLVACMDVVGWFFVLPEAVAGDAPGLLWPLLAQHVMPYRTPEGSLVDYYTYFGQRYEPAELIRARCVSLRDPYGMGYGPTQAAWSYVGLNDQFTSIQENLMTQGGRISGYLSDADATTPMGDAEAAKAETRINASWTRGGAGRIPYLPGAVKFTPLAWPPRDLAELQISDNALQRIANCLGVPLSLLKTEDVNLANAEAGQLQHAKLAVDTRCHTIAVALTRWAHRYGREHGLGGWDRLFFAFDNPVVEDAERNMRIFTSYVKDRVLKPNEVREELGHDPYDGGDEVLAATTLAPVGRVIDPPPPPPAAAAPGQPPIKPEGEKRLHFQWRSDA